MEDNIEFISVPNNDRSTDLHFRYIGTAKSRHFIVNVQFETDHAESGEALKPEEYDFMIGKILGLILARIAAHPNSALN